MSLDNSDIERLAAAMVPKMVDQIRSSHHDFWIDPEKHYKSHQNSDRLAGIFDEDMVAALKGMATSYKKGRNIFTTVFLTLVVAGSLYAAFVAWAQDKVR